MVTTSAQYNAVAKFLHWIIAFAILAMLIIGWVMTSLPNGDPNKFPLFQWHKSVGITILLLSLFRLGWRLTHTAPPLPADMPRWEAFAARATHVLFYVLIIVMPLTGWIIVSASPFNLPTLLYGVIPWPHLPVIPTLENKKEIGHFFGDIHCWLAYGIAGLFVLHAGAAWKHHLFNRDDVLLRMAPKFLHGFLNLLRGGKSAACLLLGLLLVHPAQAKVWKVDYENSKLGFIGTQGESSFEGYFKSFKTDIDFDPNHPEAGKITATIDMTSATAESPERDGALPGSDWFDTSKFPQAQFTSTTIRKASSDKCFEAAGTLTIKSIAKPLTLPFCLVPEGAGIRAQGRATLMRTDFSIGTGQWADEATVKHAVDVVVDIAAQ